MPEAHVVQGDCVEVMHSLEADSVDAIVCDPPYDLTSTARGSTPGSVAASKDVFARVKSGGFMGKAWDATGVAFDPETWSEAIRVLKPGGFLLAFGGTRTHHRMMCAIEDAGFEIRDVLSFMYGSGFPKSLDVSKSLDKYAGAERVVLTEGVPVKRMIPGADQNATGSWIKDNGRVFVPSTTAPATDDALTWQGWGTALKPAWEPVVMARKPLSESSVAKNVLKHGTGAINLDATRIGTTKSIPASPSKHDDTLTHGKYGAEDGTAGGFNPNQGRWPANVVLQHSDTCEQVGQTQVKARVINRFDDGAKPFGDGAGHPYTSTSLGDANGQETVDVWNCEPDCPVRLLDEQSGKLTSGTGAVKRASANGYQPNAFGTENRAIGTPMVEYGDTGGASRFFYTSKASTSERNERTRQAGIKNDHPTIKSIDLMRWLVKLVCRPGGTILDPFAGSGTTLVAAMMEGINSIGIEITPEYIPIIKARIDGIQIGGLFD